MTETQANQPARKRFGSFFKKVPLILDIYALIVVLFLLLMLIPNRPWPVELFSNLVSAALLPSIPLFIFWLVTKKWRSTALWLIPTLAFVFLFGALFIPNRPGPHTCDTSGEQTCLHLRVMTFNMYGKSYGGRQEQVDMLRESRADIIALQEVNDVGADLIESQLSELYPYQISLPDGIAGTGLLSKYPIRSQEIFKLAPQTFNHCQAIVDVDGVLIKVLSVHPPSALSPTELRYRDRRISEIEGLIERATTGEPVLLMGDFNLTDQTTDYRLLTGAGLNDAFREAGWGLGNIWPARLKGITGLIPCMRIDHIWHTGEISVLSAHVGSRVGSDHLPVTAEIAIGN